MRLLNFLASQLIFGCILFQYIACDCEFPDDFPDGQIILSSPRDENETLAEELYILQFRCHHGFQLIGRPYAQCIDEEWDPEIPYCTRMECSQPPDVPNAKYEVKSGTRRFPTINSIAVYTCKEGYELNNTEAFSLRCVFSKAAKKAKWIGEIPSCNEKKSCHDPGVSKFGKRRGKCCLSGTSLQFACNEGYELIGKEIIQCLPFGNWSSYRPLCKPLEEHCELPPSIPHGIVIGDKKGDYYLPEEYAQVVCEPGYKCDGYEYVYCEEGGVWEAEFGTCKEVFCDLPPPLANGTILELQSTNSTSFPHGFELTYVCDKNYRLIGDSWRVCGRTGWSGKIPKCEITQCPDPGIPENGIRMGNNYTVGESVRFRCYEGYDLLGSLERYCLPNGQWTGQLARCNLPTYYCPNPGVPVKGSKNSTNYDLGSRIGFSCQDGYTQIGSEVRECLANHTWSGSETKCLGPYDFDNAASLSEKLSNEIHKQAKQQEKELEEYNELLRLRKLYGPTGRILDLNYPGRIILYFMFDVSGSVGKHNFDKSIEFAKAVVKKVGISENGARAGALTFGSKAEVKFVPFNFNSTEDVLAALDNIEYTGGGTDTSSAFTLLKRDLFPVVDAVLGKKKVKSVIFLITDGRANMGGSPEGEAEEFKKAGVEIYCIGITGSVRKKSLYRIASKSKISNGEEYPNVYILENYATMSWIIQDITKGAIDYSECGIGLENVGTERNLGRIVGGRKSMQSWPWMAALFMDIEKDIPPKYELSCGGSIIHRHFILTAAHCLYDNLRINPVKKDRTSIIIKLGLTDTQNETYVQESGIQETFIHPKYRAGSFFDYDIALLQMENPAEYNPLVRPICLPPRELPDDSKLYKPGASSWATGWGRDAANLKNNKKWKGTQNLKEIHLPIQSKDRCIESIRGQGVNVSYFTDRMFCAGDGRGGNDTCEGDSGGPLMQQQIKPEGGSVYWTQVGIVSWGIDCGLENTYGYYTYLQRFVPWIEETIENVLQANDV